MLSPHYFYRVFAIAGREDGVPVSFERALQRPYNLALVVNNEDKGPLFAHATILSRFPQGNVTKMISPPPGRSSAQMRPPCASISPLQTARPSPEPIEYPVRDGPFKTR